MSRIFKCLQNDSPSQNDVSLELTPSQNTSSFGKELYCFAFVFAIEKQFISISNF